MSGFQTNGICAGYDGKQVIDNLSFSLEAGRVMGILGANGSGKTTLLKSICSILRHKGECMLDGVKLEKLTPRQLAQKCSYIPQRSGISIDISVLDVVLMGFNPRLGLLQHPTAAMKQQALHAIETVGLSGMKDQNYMHLSEGQKQLCILARTLVTNARLLLLDEPESALDFHYRHHMLAIIREWVKQDSRFALVTLHDPMLALNGCDDLLLLKDGRNIGVLHPQSDSFDFMKEMLSAVYGRVHIVSCADSTGNKHIVMLREGEDGF
ncbi:MAG: ABC transporter ATP-binding protein [Clostridia bacterium]|nr:ABC transporter ATP-binding protein [Clostridia bacterium]